jgi:IS30 family transposase
LRIAQLPETLFAYPELTLQDVKQAAIALLQSIKLFVKTITFGNGKEFSLHEAIA